MLEGQGACLLESEFLCVQSRLRQREEQEEDVLGFHVLFNLEEECVEYGNEDEGDERADEESAHDGDGEAAEHGVGHEGYHAQNRGERGHHDGTQTRLAALDEGAAWRYAALDFEVDFVHEHNAVLDHHADESEHADDGDESEGLAGDEHCGDDADKDEGDAAEDDGGFLVVLEQEDEDAAYEEFRNSFNNLGGTQNMAIDWYMNGINPAQKVTEDGEVLYTNTSSGAAQQLAENTGGFWMDYASAAVAPDQGSYNNIEDLLTEGTQKLSEGYGLGVGVYSYKNAEAQGKGHSLGIFGYINEIISQSVEKLAALLVSDSDDTASGQTIGREERDNTYSLYKVGSYDNGNIQSIELVDYRSEPDLHTVIGTVTSVAPYMSAKGNEEKEGSADPRSDINLVPVELAVKDTDGNELSETTPAQTVQLDVETWNNSYARIPDKATAEIVVSVTRDGKPVKSIRKIVELNNLDPLKTMLSTMNYDLSESGTYDFKVSIGGIKDGEGNAIREAYTSDNALATGFTIVIPEKETPAEEKDDLRKELPTDSETPEDPAAEEAATEKDLPPAYEVKTDEKLPASVEWIWEAYVDLSDPETFVVSFRAPVKDKMDFSVLRYLKTKEVVDLDQYEILWKGDSFELSFSKDFLKKLLPGRNDFELLYSNGRVLIRLNVM